MNELLLLAVLIGVTAPPGCSLGLPNPEESRPTWALAPSGPPQPTSKGIELYSWRGLGGEQCFALLLGTNYVKSAADVVNPRTTLVGVQELARQMSLLDPGESIRWGPPTVRDIPNSVRSAFRYPPDPVIAAVQAQARERGHEVVLLDRRYWRARIQAP